MTSRAEIKKEIIYRSVHRGCKETDHLIGGFALSKIDELSDENLSIMKDFILEDDMLIYDWIMGREKCAEKYKGIIVMIRDCYDISL